MATALLLNAIAMTVASSTFIRKRLVVWRLVLPMLALAVLASPVGVHVAQGLDRTVLLGLFATFLLFAALMILFYRPHALVVKSYNPRGNDPGPAGRRAGRIRGRPAGRGRRQHHRSGPGGRRPGTERASASASFVVLFASLTGFLAHVSVARIALPCCFPPGWRVRQGPVWCLSGERKAGATVETSHCPGIGRGRHQDRVGPGLSRVVLTTCTGVASCPMIAKPY